MANVFISHRGVDTQEATRLAEAIRDVGHVVWLDAWKIEVGDSLVGQIHEGLKDAKYVVLCLSREGIDSAWINRECMSTLARQLNDQSVKLLPVRLTGGELPAILADIKYADLVKDWSEGLASLLKAIR